MPPNLDSLPFDILFVIVRFLSLEDAVHVAWTCRQLTSILKESTLCRRVIETSARYSLEAALASRGDITYQDALQRTFRRRVAFAKADPYSVAVVARGSALIYDYGMLSTILEDTIHIINLHFPDEPKHKICLKWLYSHPKIRHFGGQYSVQLMHYSHGIIALALHPEEPSQRHLLTAIRIGSPCGDLLFVRPLESTNELFVRHNAHYLYYGTHSRIGVRGHHEWVIRGVGLDSEHPLPKDNHIQLEDFVGCELGATVTFLIHDGYFYALSNQTSNTVEEIDWTSFFTVIRFPITNPSRDALEVDRNIYRRQHAEGPIHDSWTTLSLQCDEETNQLMIVESRREWLDGGSTQTRTFYRERVPDFEHKQSSESDVESMGDAAVSSSEQAQYPDNDQFVSLISSDNHARWAPWQDREPFKVHLEYGKKGDNARSFILTKTKVRGYNLSCSSFIDLVEDGECCESGNCLRLRIGSRHLMPPTLTGRQSESVRSSQPLTDIFGEDRMAEKYRYSSIRLWPLCRSSNERNSNPEVEAHNVMNPHLESSAFSSCSLSSTMQITGISDERSLVYMVRPSRPRCEIDRVGNIVLVSFDPFMRAAPVFERQTKGLPGWERHLMWWRRATPWPGGSGDS